MKPGRATQLTAAQQFVNLRADTVCQGAGTLGSGRLTWCYEARPTPLSRAYAIRIEFSQGGVPEVFVDAPDLVALADGRLLPHVYSQRPTRLCLYLPSSGEWHRGMLISRTFVPWTSLWLLYFEEWLTSNEWKGGGEHPPPKPERSPAPRSNRSTFCAPAPAAPRHRATA